MGHTYSKKKKWCDYLKFRLKWQTIWFGNPVDFSKTVSLSQLFSHVHLSLHSVRTVLSSVVAMSRTSIHCSSGTQK